SPRASNHPTKRLNLVTLDLGYMQSHPRTLRLPSRTGAPSRSWLSTGSPNGLQFRFSQGGCQTPKGPSEDGTANLRRLRAMPVAHAPQCAAAPSSSSASRVGVVASPL